MKYTILAIATEPEEYFYKILKSLPHKYKVYFLTTQTSPFHEAKNKQRLKALNADFVDSRDPKRALADILVKNTVKELFLFIKHSSFIREICRDVHLVSPETKVVVFTGDMGLFYDNKDLIKANLGGFIESFRENILTAYAQAGLIVTRNEKDKKLLLDKTGYTKKRVLSLQIFKNELKRKAVSAEKKIKFKADELVSIIMPCYDQLAYTKQCIDSIAKYAGVPYELIVIDNGSNDGTAQYLRSLNNLQVITNKNNMGLVCASNQGMKAAKGKYLLLVNNDIVFTSGALSRMIECANSSRSIGLVGPCTNRIYGVQQIETGYKSIKDLEKWAYLQQKMHYGSWFEAFWLACFCLLIKREVINKAGLLDNRYGMGHFEDHDYCLMARKAGFKIFCCKDAFVHHFGTKTYTVKDVAKLDKRNRKLFIKKWGKETHDFLMESLMFGTLMNSREN